MKKILILILVLFLVSCQNIIETEKDKEMIKQVNEEETILKEIEIPEEKIEEIKEEVIIETECCCMTDKGYAIMKNCSACVGDVFCEQKEIMPNNIVDIVNEYDPETKVKEPFDKVCCIVPIQSYEPYEKAYDTTRQRCHEMKGTALNWEKCYEIVCCEWIGRISLRKFMDCKTERAKILSMEECKNMQPPII